MGDAPGRCSPWATLTRPVVVVITWLLLGGTSIGAATAGELAFVVDARDSETGILRISFELTGYPYPEVDLTLGSPPVDAETYFQFFDDLEFSTAGGRELIPTRSVAGRVHLEGIDGSLRGSYSVAVAELNRVEPSGVRGPTLTPDHLVLPLRSVLALPEEIETRGLVVSPLSIRFELPDGWPLLTPWVTYDATFRFREDAVSRVHDGVVAAGAFDVTDHLDQNIPTLGLVTGADAEASARIIDVGERLVRHYVGEIGSYGGRPVTFIVEVVDGVADAKSFGGFVRIQCPSSALETTPADLRVGTDAHRFYLEMAHEIFHNWVGVTGLLKPLGAEVFWVTEGMADYEAAIALTAIGITESQVTLDWLAALAERLQVMPHRSDPIDESMVKWESDPGYRELVLVKGPLACFVIDAELRTARKEGNSLFSVIKQIFYTSFLSSGGRPMTFGPAELGKSMERVLGLRGRLVLGTCTQGDLMPVLPEKAAEMGITWDVSETGQISAGLYDGPSVFRDLLTPEGQESEADLR